MNNKAIEFNIGEETRPVIETGEKILESSIFSEQYNKAFSEINNYLNQVEKISKENSFDKSHNENINNIFAFIGERGSGKTSCMLSVGKVLVESQKPDTFDTSFPEIKKKKFHAIDLIDPSFFDKKNNILAIIVAKLFKEFDKNSKKRCNDDNYDKKRILVEKFQETQRNLKCLIDGKEFSEDDLDQLIALSAAVDLRSNIHDLVEAYLDYFGNKDAKLLIMVDDIDLHTEYAMDMVEQIRKYLIQPNIVILMALKVDQLATVKRLHFTNEFKELLVKDRGQLTFDAIDNMVDKYLTKLLPHQHRVYVPELVSIFERPLKLIIKNDLGKIMDIQYNVANKKVPIREAVPMLIFQKTRFLFYNTKYTTSYIVPDNLRELRHLIKMLFDMDDYLSEKRPEYNKTLFKKYFFENWTINNLDSDGQSIIKNILSISDAVLINKQVIKLMKIRFENELTIKDNAELSSEINAILNVSNKVYNLSLGDVFAIINLLERTLTKHEDQKLLFAIKTI